MSDGKEDTLNDIEEMLGRYKAFLFATMAKDIQIYEEALDFQRRMRVISCRLAKQMY